MKTRLISRIMSLLLIVSLLAAEAVPALASETAEAEPSARAETDAESAETSDGQESGQAEDSGTADEGSADSDEQANETPADSDSANGDGAADQQDPSTDQDSETDELSDTSTDSEMADTQDPDAETPDGDANAAQEEESAEETDDELAEAELAEQQAMEELAALLQQAMALHASDTDYDYATELAKFPSSYQSYLEELHEEHPNWIFVAVDTGLDWDDVISGELGSASTIEYTFSDLLLNNHSGYYSTSSYSSTDGYKPIDSSHVSCSRAAIAFYMDPRNFLTEKYIFQFEDLTFNQNVQKLTGVQTILKNANNTSNGLYNKTTYITTAGETANLSDLSSYGYGSDYSSIIYNVGMTVDVSPYFLASKIAQETGAVTTNGSISGNYTYNGKSYTGYYNFYNIGAYASATGGAVANGLTYAKNHNWSNPVLAIYGGAEYISNQYIGKGQNTIYYMRFNVGPDAYYRAYAHQYMSAIYATASEASKTYSAYSKVGAEDSSFLFFIPVFDNMPSKTSKVTLTPTTTGKTNTSCGLYSSPAVSSSKLLTLSSGASVTVLSGSATQDTGYSNRLNHPFWYEVKVTVSGKTYTGYVDEENVTLNAVYNIKNDTTKSISSIVSKSGTTGTLYYETSDPSVATVTDAGIISAQSNGSCTIYVISGGGSFDAIGITVSDSGTTTSDSGSVPTQPSITSVSNLDGSVKINWSKVSDATGYTLWRKKSGDTSWTKIATISSGSTVSYQDTSVSNNTTYSYTLRATNANGASSYDKTGTSILYLQMPTLSQAAAYADGIGVQWNTVTGASSYDLYRKSGSGSWSKLTNLSAVSGSIQGYTDGTAVKGTTYTYTVRARYGSYSSYYKTSGISAKSVTTNAILNTKATSQVNYRTGAGTSYSVAGTISSGALVQIVPGTTVQSGGATWYQLRLNGGSTIYYINGAYLLLPPTLKKAENINGGIRVTWTTQSNATGYYIYRKSGSGNWSRIGSSITGQYDDTTVTSGTVYTYTVRSISSSGMSDYDRSGVSQRYLAVPTLTSVKASGNTLQVTWSAITGASGYYVYRKSGSGSWSRLATISSGSTVTYADTTAEYGVSYTYTVRAVNGSAISQYDHTGISGKLSGTVTLEKQVVKASAKYYSGMNTSSAAGTLSANTTVSVVSGWSQTSGGVTWRKVKIGSSYYYIAASSLLATPTLSKLTIAAKGLQVTWSKESAASGYFIYRKGGGSSSWKRIASVSSNSTVTYLDQTVTSGQSYTYTVRAYYGSVLSGYDSTGVSSLFLAAPVLSSAKASSSGITVSWSKVTGATQYRIYRKTSGGSWSFITSCTAASYTDTSSLTAGVTYIYTVRAYGSSVLSGYDASGVSATAASSTVTLVNYVTTGQLNYRTTPDKSSSSNIAGTFASGATVQIVSGWSQTVDGTTWYKCYVDGKYYYVSAKYLQKA